MEPIPALNQLMKESHKYILSMYATGSHLYIVLQHTEKRDTTVTAWLPIEPTQASLEEAVFSQPILTRNFEKVFFIADSPRYTFIPKDFASPDDNPLYFGFCFPDSNGSVVSAELPHTGVQLLFDLDTERLSFIRRTFDRPVVLHRLAPMCEYFYRKSRLGYNAKLYAHWGETSIDLFGFNQQGFLLANSFAMHHVNDGIYYILNAWKQLGFNTTDDELSLSGDHRELRQNIIPLIRRHLAFITLTKFPSYAPAGDESLPLPLRLITAYTR